MAYTKLASVILIVMLLPRIQAGLVCYGSCMTAVVATGVVAGPAVLPALGFTSTGVAAGSWAAGWMATYGGAVTAGSLFATLQSIGATGGVLKWTGIPYVNAVCSHLCY